MKYGLTALNVPTTTASQSNWPSMMVKMLLQPYVALGFSCYAIGALMWLFVLSKIDVSMAYPFVGLGFVLTMLLGAVLLGEQVGVWRIVGTGLVIGGILLVMRS
jgi:drug/metabolite transporter (DMT)-like permease